MLRSPDLCIRPLTDWTVVGPYADEGNVLTKHSHEVLGKCQLPSHGKALEVRAIDQYELRSYG
ncbi:MAG TPA: hypothetical protein VN428_16010 [Bryobacteraceae bacterium]|nr:hypothetical protein [Bryobacteraceae bacterium]